MPPGIVFDAAALKIKVTSMTVGSKCTNGYRKFRLSFGTSGWVQEIPLILWYLWLGTGNSAYPLVPLAGYRGIPLILSYLWLGTGEFRLSFGTSGWVQENSGCLLVNDGNENVAGNKDLFAFFQTISQLFRPAPFVKCVQFFSGV